MGRKLTINADKNKKQIPETIVLHFKPFRTLLGHATEGLSGKNRIEAKKLYRERLAKWLSFDDMLTIEFDLDKMTAQVLEKDTSEN